MITNKTEGERVMELLSSFFYDIKAHSFKLEGLQVNQIQNGNYKIEFVIDNNEELLERKNKEAEAALQNYALPNSDE